MIKFVIVLFASMAVLSSWRTRHVSGHVYRRETIQGYQCNVSVNSTGSLKPGYFPNGTRICVKLSEQQLFEKLKQIGGWNPVYTAMTEEQAENFPDPRWFLEEEPTPKPCLSITINVNSTAEVSSSGQSTERRAAEQEGSLLRDSKTEAKVLSKRANKCWKRGDAVATNTGLYHLCGECHVVTTLNHDMTPRLINEAPCKHNLVNGDPLKDYSTACVYSSGLCYQKVLHFPALHSTGRYRQSVTLSFILGQAVYVEDPEEITLRINAGCECQMFGSSMDRLNPATYQKNS